MTLITRGSVPEQGQLVTVRQRRYVVTELTKSTLPEQALKVSGNGAQHLITLSSVEDDALGEELQVIWELEPGAEVIEKVALPEPTGFDDPKELDAFVVIGGDSYRLHEEIITAGGSLREGRFARLNVGEVKEALDAMKTDEPSTAMKQSLLGLYPKHADALRAALEARMNDRTSGLQKALGERAAKEVDDIQAILTELKRTIEDKLDDPELNQMIFDGWGDEERHQLERNMTALRARVLEIPGEIKRETEAIKKRFADPQPRMFPVSVTFLVPEKMARG